ncbi:hypothetical protein BsIDN1_25110 [Bacillus safensis]|uniref:Uncharacterized protein n=1 Tax=Bacillus safensis TaxID=561879 RepID=A0A5S9M6Z5_BACIA|nr:hypothetical protein BsIDN1_25110 [Bacillus safensis]
MTFKKKAFNIGYFVLLLSFIVVYFFASSRSIIYSNYDPNRIIWSISICDFQETKKEKKTANKKCPSLHSSRALKFKPFSLLVFSIVIYDGFKHPLHFSKHTICHFFSSTRLI